MPPKKGKTSGSELQKHLDTVKKDLKILTDKISKTNRTELSKLSYEASKTVGDTASEIIKSSSVLLDKASKVLHGAIDGGKKAMEKERAAKPKPAAKRKAAPKKKNHYSKKNCFCLSSKKNHSTKKYQKNHYTKKNSKKIDACQENLK